MSSANSHLGPIFRALARNKTRSLLLIVEIAVTVAVVLNCANMILGQLERINTPTGIAEDDLIAVNLQPFSAAYQDFAYRRQIVDQDLAALHAMPGVVSASVISSLPLQGGGSSTQVKPLGGKDSQLVRSPVYSGDPQLLETLGLSLVAGKRLTEADVPAEPGPRIANVLVTQDLADALFPDGDALGQTIDTGSAEYPDVIVGIVSPMFTPYGGGPMETQILFYANKPSGSQNTTYLVRAEPGAYDEVFAHLDATFLGVQADRVVTVRTMDTVRSGGFLQNTLIAGIFSAVAILLIFVTTLGIFGITAFTVTQRTKQIGTRRALGATRSSILLHFLIESSILSGFGLALGLFAAYGLNVLMVESAGAPRLGLAMVGVGTLLMWALGLFATWMPARRAARLAPALATRTV